MSLKTLVTAITNYAAVDESSAKQGAAEQLSAALANVCATAPLMGRLLKQVLQAHDSSAEEGYLVWEMFLAAVLEDSEATKDWKDLARAWQPRLEMQRKAAGVTTTATTTSASSSSVQVEGKEEQGRGGGGSDTAGFEDAMSRGRLKPPKLPEYHGERGECGEWWSSVQEMFSILNTPEGDRLSSVMLALKDAASKEFWAAYKAQKGQGGKKPTVTAVMDTVVTVFDGGMAPTLLMSMMGMEQESGETALAFRARFMQVMRGLEAQGLKVPEPMLAVMFGIKLRDWKSIAVKQPQSIAEVLEYLNEAGLEDKQPGFDGMAMAARHSTTKANKAGKCWVCGDRGHYAAKCKKKKGSDGDEAGETAGAAMVHDFSKGHWLATDD